MCENAPKLQLWDIHSSLKQRYINNVSIAACGINQEFKVDVHWWKTRNQLKNQGEDAENRSE
jgi:hypothetical protein